jgi:hypothetical protein
MYCLFYDKYIMYVCVKPYYGGSGGGEGGGWPGSGFSRIEHNTSRVSARHYRQLPL